MLASVSLSSLTGEPACPPAAGDSTPPVAIPALASRASPVRLDRAGRLGRPRRREPLVDPVLALGLAPRVVGCVRRERPRGDAGRRPGRWPGPDAGPSRIVPLMHRHEVEPGDVELRDKMRHADGPPLTPVPPDAKAVFFGASYHADYATLLAAPARPAGRRRGARRLLRARRRPAPPAPVGRGRPPPAPLRRPGGRRARARLRAPRDEPRLDDQPRARGRLPRRDAARGRDDRRLPRHAGQEGAPRDPAQGPPRRGGGRGPPRRLADPLADLEAFIDLHQRRWGVDGLFPDTPGGAQSRRVLPAAVRAVRRRRRRSRLAFLTVGGRRIAAGISFETRGRDPVLQRRRGPRRARALAGRAHGRALRAPRARARRSGAWTSCAATSRTSTSGAPSTSRSSACWSDERKSDDAPAGLTTPASRPCPAPSPPGPDRIRVVQVLATGTNGGAQEHVYNLVSRMDRDALRRLGRLAVAGERRAQARAGRHRRHGHRRARRRDRDRRPSPPTSPTSAPTSIHNHMYRAEIVGTRRRSRWARRATAGRGSISTVHSSRVRSREDQDELRRLDAVDRPPDRGLELDRPQGRRRGPDRAPRSTDLQRRRPRALRPPGAVLHAPRRVRHGADAADRRRRRPAGAGEGPPDAARGLARCCERVPDAYLLIVGEGSRLDALHQIARDAGRSSAT